MVNRGALVELEIKDLAFGGNGIARLSDGNGEYVLFVENAFPGQKVLARVKKKKKRFAECKIVAVLERSPEEEESPYQEISGAPYIHVPPKTQEKYKQAVTLDVYERLGGIKNISNLFDAFIPSPDHYHYRNKMEYSFSSIVHDIETGKEHDDAFGLGFKHRGTWWKVENLDRPSGLFDPEWETFLSKLRNYLQSSALPAWHPPQKTGFYRHIVVRKSFYQNQLLINLVTSSEGRSKFDAPAFAQFIIDHMGNRIAGIQHTINDNVADRAKIENGTTTLLYGEPIITERLLGLDFEISMESFFQTNPKSAERLYTKALDYVFESGDELGGEYVMDLFCGTGTIGQLMAKRIPSAKIIGVDIVEEAIEDARRNAQRNGVENIDFYAADVGKFLLEYPQFEGKIGTIVLDPPRAGIAPKTLRKVMRLLPQRIVYISCNPSTQARDAKTLIEEGFSLKKISLVDQFPHTSHIEAVALFER